MAAGRFRVAALHSRGRPFQRSHRRRMAGATAGGCIVARQNSQRPHRSVTVGGGRQDGQGDERHLDRGRHRDPDQRILAVLFQHLRAPGRRAGRSRPPARRSPSIRRRAAAGHDRRRRRRRPRRPRHPGAGDQGRTISRHLHPGAGRRRAQPRRDRHHGAEGTPVSPRPTARSRSSSSPTAAAGSPSTSARPTSAGPIITRICRATRRGLPRAAGQARAGARPRRAYRQRQPRRPAPPFRDQPDAAGREMVPGRRRSIPTRCLPGKGPAARGRATSFHLSIKQAIHEDQRRGHPSRQHHRI